MNKFYQLTTRSMHRIIFSAALFFLFYSCTSKSPKNDLSDSSISAFDSTLAAQLGADEYGMKKYIMAFLKRGPNRSQDSATAAQLQKAHLDNISRLAEEGTLVLAGPFFGDSELRGIYIFDVQSIEEAEALTRTDPAIQQGRLTMELMPWYGTAALKQVNDLHSKIAKINI